MRNLIMLLGCTALAACGGGDGQGPTSPGSVAVGPSGGSNGNQPVLMSQATARTYVGVGGAQTFSYMTDDRGLTGSYGQQASSYGGGTSTVRNSNISIAYDPTSAVFTLSVSDGNGAATNTSFQDPANRTNFGGGLEPQWGTPHLANANIHYLQAGDGNPLSLYQHSGSGYLDYGTNSRPATGETGSGYQATSLFYQEPGATNNAGTVTKYVSYAGYARNAMTFGQATVGGSTINTTNWHLERGAFAFGDLTSQSAVPTSGSGTYEGGMLATAVINPTLDNAGTDLPSFYQWIDGTSRVSVNFGSGAVTASFDGTVLAPQLDARIDPTSPTGFSPASLDNPGGVTQSTVVTQGAHFSATGSGTINLTSTGGFSGTMTGATFTNSGSASPTVSLSSGNGTIAGSTLTGAFYGPGGSPDKVEVGGGFRVVGGTPDQRIDIIGGFAGARTGN